MSISYNIHHADGDTAVRAGDLKANRNVVYTTSIICEETSKNWQRSTSISFKFQGQVAVQITNIPKLNIVSLLALIVIFETILSFPLSS